MTQKSEYDPQHEDFDPYICWEKANCLYVDEMTYEDENGEVVDEGLYCGAPCSFICPLYEMMIKNDLECDIIKL